MLAYTDLRTGYRPFFRRVRDARLAGPAMFSRPAATFADAGEPAAFPAARLASRAVAEADIAPAIAPAPSFAPAPDARLRRRLRHVVRRRVKVELDGLVRASVSDGEIDLHVTTVSARDPKVIEWSADRLVALVVLHDGCGARVIGGGGLMGRLELPSITCAGAFLAFCYDGEAAVALS
ncbi:MAG TPA: hypothetical protein VFL03_03145 [Candidatus Limnocylindrales bacterium]|jgi:hypothetical protein|nr:hypothetical protein [Candidatus Limnocylindrales bacterium]